MSGKGWNQELEPMQGRFAEQEEHHGLSPLQYLMVYGALLAFTLMTVVVAYIDLGAFNPAIALAIACVKMVIVLLFFMHLKNSSRLIRMTVATGFVIFLVLLVMTLTDYISRAWGRW